MPLDINGYNPVFNSFVQFAQQRAAANDDTAVVDASFNRLDGRKVLAVTQSLTDSVHKWTRGVEEWVANDYTRDLFRKSVANLFGGESKIPESVKKAMLLGDYGQGKPLTARRILAVKAAIDPFAENFREKVAAAKAAATNAYGKADREPRPGKPVVTRAQVDGLVESTMKSVGNDPDALDVLVSRGVMDRILVRGDASLRTSAEAAKKAKAIVENIAELKQAAAGDPAILKAGKAFLAQLGGKGAPAGIIAAMVRAARGADVSALRRLSASSSGLAIHKALNQSIAEQVRISAAAGVDTALDGADEKSAARDFIGALFVYRCGAAGIRRMQAALESENARKLHAIYQALENGQFDRTGISDGALRQTTIMGARARNMLDQLKITVDVCGGVPENRVVPISDFEDDFSYGEFGAPAILGDLVAAARAEARRTHDKFLAKIVRGDSAGADALRRVYHNRIGAEAFGPDEEIRGSAYRNIMVRLNWTIAAECRKFATGRDADSAFAKDLARIHGSVELPGGGTLSGDFATARDQLAEFVTKGARKTYASLDAPEKGRVHVVMALLSQETCNATIDGHLQAAGPKNSKPPVSHAAGPEGDRARFTLAFEAPGILTLSLKIDRSLATITTDPGDGNPVTTEVGKGSAFSAGLSFGLTPGGLDRLGSLDYTAFDDTRAKEIAADPNAKDKVSAIEKNIAPEFRFQGADYDLRSGFFATIN